MVSPALSLISPLLLPYAGSRPARLFDLRQPPSHLFCVLIFFAMNFVSIDNAALIPAKPLSKFFCRRVRQKSPGNSIAL
jgi:hypothetical protein